MGETELGTQAEIQHRRNYTDISHLINFVVSNGIESDAYTQPQEVSMIRRIQRARNHLHPSSERLRPYRLTSPLSNLHTILPEQIQSTLERDTSRDISDAIFRLETMHLFFAGSTPDEENRIRSTLFRAAEDGLDPDKLDLIEVLFCKSESDEFSSELSRLNIDINRLPDILNDEHIFPLISAMLDKPQEYKFQLGIVLSQIPLGAFPEDIRRKINPTLTDLELKLKVEHDGWHLCDEAEPKIRKAMDSRAIVTLGNEEIPYFLVKFIGKMSALCLKDLTNKDGNTFIAGNWYSPNDPLLRLNLRRAFNEGDGWVTFNTGELTFMRSLFYGEVNESTSLLTEAIEYSNKNHRTIPDYIEGMSRQDFASHYYE